jgi:hypothetical protein
MIASPRHPECDLSDLCPENCISPPSDRPGAEIMRPAGFETRDRGCLGVYSSSGANTARPRKA